MWALQERGQKNYMSNEEFELIKARFAKVSPGVWTPYIEGIDFMSGSSFIMVQDDNVRRDDIELIGASEADIDFIGHAKRDIDLLIQEIERLRKLKSSSV